MKPGDLRKMRLRRRLNKFLSGSNNENARADQNQLPCHKFIARPAYRNIPNDGFIDTTHSDNRPDR